MGGLLDKIGQKKEVQLVMAGLDGAGKTTILYNLKLGGHLQLTPTVGFNVETIPHKKHNLVISDVGGQERTRPLWAHHYLTAKAVIFVIDSAESSRFAEVKTELEKLVQEQDLIDKPILVFANKQDLPNALKQEELSKVLSLPQIFKSREYRVQESCAIHGDGLRSGLDYIVQYYKDKEK